MNGLNMRLIVRKCLGASIVIALDKRHVLFS